MTKLSFKNAFLAALATTALFSSCGKKSEDVACKTGITDIRGLGFSPEDFSNAKIYKYQHTDYNDTLLDSMALNYQIYHEDTSVILFNSATMAVPGYYYRLSFPALGVNYMVIDLSPSGQTHKIFTYTKGVYHRPFECYNATMSCTINGVLQTTQSTPHDERTRVIYIQKL